MSKNFSHSFGSFTAGFVAFMFLGLVSIGLGILMEEEGIVEEPGGWIFVFGCLSLYFSIKFARLIAQYKCGLASPGWTAFFDKTSKAFGTTLVLGGLFLALALIVGERNGGQVFAILFLFSPIMSIYYAFIHPSIKNWVTSLFQRRKERPTYGYNPLPSSAPPAGNKSWFKEKVIPAIITSTLPVIISWYLTENVAITISTPIIGTIALLSTGKGA